MPLKKQIQKLECLAVRELGEVLKKCCLKSAELISEHHSEEKICDVRYSALDSLIADVSSMLLVLTPHYCHDTIVTMILDTLSQLHSPHMISMMVPSSQVDRRKKMVWKQVVNRWSSVLCVDTVVSITPRPETDLGLIMSLCHVLPDCVNIVHLSLQPWSCVKHKFLDIYEVTTIEDIKVVIIF